MLTKCGLQLSSFVALVIVALTIILGLLFSFRAVRSGTAGFNDSCVIGTFVLSFLAISNLEGLNPHFNGVDRYDSRARYR